MAAADESAVRSAIIRWRDDPRATYRTWFLWEDRLKNFRSIRRGLEAVVSEIETGHFGNVYKGSSLETVVGSIAEQRQIFKGADHAFLWKPKLRIPDIYENAENQKAFGRFLATCLCSCRADELNAAIGTLAAKQIKGVGPAAANLLYFLHPTLVPPFNTAIVRGYNAVTGAHVKLGSWPDYLAMRDGILRLNATYRDLLSNDLGAIAGFLFDIGRGAQPALGPANAAAALEAWKKDLQKHAAAAESSLQKYEKDDHTHAQIQAWLRDLGRSLGFEVWIALNDRGRLHEGVPLGEGCCDDLPVPASIETVRLIDVLWIDKKTNTVAAAFEVEHTTSIYSGILRLLDLAQGVGRQVPALYLVAPDAREVDVAAQVRRPAFRAIAGLHVRYLPYGELAKHRESIARFGQGLRPIEAIARDVA